MKHKDKVMKQIIKKQFVKTVQTSVKRHFAYKTSGHVDSLPTKLCDIEKISLTGPLNILHQ